MKKSDCDEFIENGFYEFYLDDVLEDEEKQQVEDHLTQCADCRAYFERTKNMEMFISDSLSDAHIPDLEERLVHGFRKAVSPRRTFQFNRYMKAASFLIFASITGFIMDPESKLQAPMAMYADSYRETGMAMSVDSENIEEEMPEDNSMVFYSYDTYDKGEKDVFDHLPREMRTRDQNLAKKSKNLYRTETNDNIDFAEAEGKPENEIMVKGFGGGTLSSNRIGESRGGRQNKGLASFKDTQKQFFEGKWTADEDVKELEENLERAKEQQKVVFRKRADTLKAEAPAEEPRAKASKPTLNSPDNAKADKKNREFEKQSSADSSATQGLKLVRTGRASYEVENYNSTVKRLEKLAKENEGYLASESSNRKQNGKMEGQLLFRIKAVNFTSFMENIKGIGDVKYQNVQVQDVTKSYFDMESHIEALEARKASLLKALEERKGDLEAYVKFETKLAEVLKDINKTKGNLKFLKHQVSYSTLYLTLVETGSNQAAVLVHSENSSMKQAVPDVDKAFLEAKKIAKELKVNVLASRVNHGKTRLSTTGYLVFQGTTSSFDSLIKMLSDLGHVSELVRNSEDKAPRGHQAVNPTLRKEGLGTLKVNLYHLPEFVVDKNQLVVHVANIPTVYNLITDMEDDNFKISHKEIDSFTDDAKRCRFRIKINKNNYNEKIARLRSLGKVHIENGSPIQARTAEGEPLPAFQKKIVQLDISFNTLNPILTRKLDIHMETEDVQHLFLDIKKKAREQEGFEILNQYLSNASKQAKQARLSYKLPAEHYDSFVEAISQAHVTYESHWDLSDSPDKVKDIPNFQKKKAQINIELKRLNPVVVEERHYVMKVYENDLSSAYSALRAEAKKVEGHALSQSRFNPKDKRVQFSVTVSEDSYETMIHSLLEKLPEGAIAIEQEKWLREENADTPLATHVKKVAKLNLRFHVFKPTTLNVAKIKLHSDAPADIIKQASQFSSLNGELIKSHVRSLDDETRQGEVEVQMNIDQYDKFISTFKSYKGTKVISDKDASGNVNDPKYKDAWLVGRVHLTVTNDPQGILTAADSSNYFGQIWDSVSGGFAVIFKYLMIGGPFILFVYALYALARKAIGHSKPSA